MHVGRQGVLLPLWTDMASQITRNETSAQLEARPARLLSTRLELAGSQQLPLLRRTKKERKKIVSEHNLVRFIYLQLLHIAPS